MVIPTTYITLGITEIDKDKFEQISNRTMFCKPSGGLWSSPYNLNSTYISDWDRWCDEESFSKSDNEIGVVFELEDCANILVIDSLEDLESLLYKFSQTDVIIDGYNMSTFGGKYLDFELLSGCSDGILLTSKGQIETRMSLNNLYGWDCESLLLFNLDCIKSQRVWRKEK